MLRFSRSVFFLAAAIFAAAAAPAIAAPSLTSISPTSGAQGTQVTLNGSAFGSAQGANGAVWLGNKLAGSIVSWSDTQIIAVVASGAASGSAQVKQNNLWSNSLTFTVPTPSITSISPTSGYPGTQVTINGTNFGATQGSGSVWLGNKLAGSIVSWSNTQIVAVVAATAASGSAQVQQNGVWSNSITFTVITPNITSVSPTTAYPGASVTINGTNFGATQGSGSVWLGNKLAGSIVSWSNTQIVATVSATAASGSVQVQQGGVWSNSIAFTVITPSLTSITPTNGVAGTQVTFTGTNFGATQGSGSVWLGSKLAGSIVSWSNTQIVATVDSGSITGNAIVQQGGVWSNSIAFTVNTPTLSSVSPTTASAGDQVTLTGTNFGATQGTGSVWLGSKLAGSIVSWSNTQIVATVASGAVTGTAQVQQSGVWSNSIALTVITPNVTSISPTSGPVGTQVTFTGTGFGATQGSGLVWIGTKYATVVSWSNTQVVATVAAASATGGAQVYQNGVWSNAITFTVTAVTLNTLYASGENAIGGIEDAEGNVELSDVAPAGGIVVALSSNNAAASVPATVTVPEGEQYGFFTITTTAVTSSVLVTISATYGGTTKTATIEILPPGVSELYFDDTQLSTGGTTTGHVVLHAAAPAGGAVVTLTSSDDDLLSMPATVTVPAGQTATTFTATAGGPVAASTNVSATASRNGSEEDADVTLLPPTVTAISFTPSTITGPGDVTVEVTLSEPVAAGTTVTFESTEEDAAPAPDPLVLTAGATTGTTTIHAGGVDHDTIAVITASIESPGASASLTVEQLALTLDSVSVSPTSVVGSNPVTVTVTLTEPAQAGGLEVDLIGYIAPLPPFVIVPEGEISVDIPVETEIIASTPGSGSMSGPFVGRHAYTERYANLVRTTPLDNYVQGFSLATSRTAGGNLVTVTVTLYEAAGSGGAVISLQSDNTGVATVPATVTVPLGDTTTTFDIDTDAVTQPVDVWIRGTYNGVISKARLTVVPSPSTISLESLTVPWDTVISGDDMTATVTLSAAAPAGGITVTLGGSRAGLAAVPASVTVPEGQTTATFTVTTTHWNYTRMFEITATYDNLTRKQLIEARPYPE